MPISSRNGRVSCETIRNKRVCTQLCASYRSHFKSWKELFNVLAILLITCADNRERHRLKVNVGETNEEKHKIEFLTELLMKHSYGLVRMIINSEGNCCMGVS